MCDGYKTVGGNFIHLVEPENNRMYSYFNLENVCQNHQMLTHIQPNPICTPYQIFTGTGWGRKHIYHNNIQTQCAGGSGSGYFLRDLTRNSNHGGGIHSPDYIGTTRQYYNCVDLDNNWADSVTYGSAVNAHVFTGDVYDFMYLPAPSNAYWSMQRNGIDGNGQEGLYCDVETIAPTIPMVDNAAVYLRGPHCVLVGRPLTINFSAACYNDVLAHEWAHGFTEFGSFLDVFGEAGAVNESFSDMFAAYFNRYKNGQTTDWWIIGKNYFPSGNVDVRNMKYPHNRLEAAAYYTDPLWHNTVGCTPTLVNDNCYVHTNMGVPNLMFYLLAAGGQNPYYSSYGTVNGVGVDTAFMIAYIANTYNDEYYRWNPNMRMDEARKKMVRVAYHRFNRPDWALEVTKAWKAVNVRCPYIPGDTNNNGQLISSDVTRFVLVYRGFDLQGECQECMKSDGSIFLPAFDMTGDCRVDGADVTRLVNYFTGLGPAPSYCPEFPPFTYPH